MTHKGVVKPSNNKPINQTIISSSSHTFPLSPPPFTSFFLFFKLLLDNNLFIFQCLRIFLIFLNFLSTSVFRCLFFISQSYLIFSLAIPFPVQVRFHFIFFFFYLFLSPIKLSLLHLNLQPGMYRSGQGRRSYQQMERIVSLLTLNTPRLLTKKKIP